MCLEISDRFFGVTPSCTSLGRWVTGHIKNTSKVKKKVPEKTVKRQKEFKAHSAAFCFSSYFCTYWKFWVSLIELFLPYIPCRVRGLIASDWNITIFILLLPNGTLSMQGCPEQALHRSPYGTQRRVEKIPPVPTARGIYKALYLPL